MEATTTASIPDTSSVKFVKKKKTKVLKKFKQFVKEDLDEALDMKQRLQRSKTMKRNAKKIAKAKARAAKHMASSDKLKSRAEKQARDIFKKKLASKMSGDSELSLKQKEEIEKKLSKMKAKIKKTAIKLFPQVKQAELDRVKKLKDATPVAEEMDPTKHVSKDGDDFIVVDKDGEEVKRFKNKEEADKYAIANHDALMGEE